MGAMGGEDNPQTKMNNYSLGCCIVASLISIVFGYDTGVMSGALIFIKEELHISESQVATLAGILNWMALIGSLTAGRASDWMGRRYTIILASVIFLIGSVLMGYAPTYAVLLAGRCVAGLGVGYALMIAPVYSAEISSPSYRGFLTSLPELCISLGILTGYISNYFFGKLTLKLGWRLMLGIAAVPSIILAVAVLKMPESPRWLIMQGRLRDAKEILQKISNCNEEAELRFVQIKIAAGIDEHCNDDYVKVSKKTHGEGVWKELLLRPTPAVRRILLAAVGIHFFEHATGIEAIVLYGPRIFKKAGVHSKDKLLLTTIGVGITKTTFILVSTFLLDKAGRRRLLLTSVGGMIVALAAIGTGLTIVAHHPDEKLVWALVMCIASVYTFVAFFSVGLAPVSWVYSSEIFPLKLRAQGASIGVAVNRAVNATISMTFIYIYEAITIGGAFFMFSGISVIAWVFFYYFLPETKGRSLEEIEVLFDPNAKSMKVMEE